MSRPRRYPYTRSQWKVLYRFNHEIFRKEPYLLNNLTFKTKEVE